MLSFSKTVGYGIEVLTILRDPGGRRISTTELGADLTINKPYLAKVINRLSHHNLIDTQRGPGGGMILARPASEISLYEVVLIFEPTVFDDCCLLGMDPRSAYRFCPCQEFFGEITEAIRDRLKSLSIGDLVEFHERAEKALEKSRDPSSTGPESNAGPELSPQSECCSEMTLEEQSI